MPCGAELASAGSWLQEVRSALQGLRSPRRRSIMAVAELIRRSFNKAAGVAMPGVKRMAELLGTISKRTVQRAIRHLKDSKLLATVARGRSADWTIHGQSDREVFALIRPAKKVFVTPSVSLAAESVDNPIRRAMSFARKALGVEESPKPTDSKRNWPKYLAPQSKESELKATVAFMQLISEGDARIYRRTSPRRLRNTLVGLFRGGANIAQLKYMLNHQPSGAPWPHDGATGVRDAVGWTAARLRPWRGQPIPHVVDVAYR